MKTVLLSAVLLLSLSKVSHSQTIMALPPNLSNIVPQQILSTNANGITLDASTQQQIVDKLNVLYTNLNSSPRPDSATLVQTSNQNKIDYKYSKYPKLQNDLFGQVTSIDEILQKCSQKIQLSSSVEEMAYLVFVSYSIQIEQGYEVSLSQRAPRQPHSTIGYLEAAGIGFVFCGPFCGTATLLIYAFWD